MHQRVGFWAAILTVLLTAATAVAGVTTPARSGPFCGPTTWACVPAPYTDVAQFIPGDYLWLIPAILLAPVFVVLMAAVHASAPEPRRIFSRIAMAFALGYAVVIGVDYFVQFAVVIPSLQAGETEGMSLFTQYNPHGLFIAGEAFGYLAMSLTLLFAAPVVIGGRIERAIRWLFVVGFALAVAALVALWIVGGDLIAGAARQGAGRIVSSLPRCRRLAASTRPSRSSGRTIRASATGTSGRTRPRPRAGRTGPPAAGRR